MNYGIGWFGVPGARTGTKTHIVRHRKPICGSVIGKKSKFQWCSPLGNYDPECRKCEKVFELLKKATIRAIKKEGRDV